MTSVDRAKFHTLSFEDQLKVVQEEAFVIALERSVFQQSGRGIVPAYFDALKRLVTSLSKGWFALFIVENFETLSKCPLNYYTKAMENSDRLVPLK